MKNLILGTLAILFLYANTNVVAQNTTIKGKGFWEAFDIPTPICPRFEGGCASIWTGKEFILYGGLDVTHEKSYFDQHKPDGYFSESNGFTFTDGWILNPEDNSWRKMPPAPVMLSGYGIDNVWSGRYIFFWNPKNTSCAIYDYEKNSWKRVSTTNMPSTGRNSVAVTWTGKEFFVWGGRNYQGTKNYNDGALYNPETDTWRKVAATSLLSARNSIACQYINGKVYLTGGMMDWNTTFDDGAIYDPVTNSWQRMAKNPFAKNFYFRSMIVENRYLILDGGTFVYDTETDSWENNPSIRKIASEKAIFTKFVDGEELIALDGSEHAYKFNIKTKKFTPLHSDWGTPESVNGHQFRYKDHYVCIMESKVYHYFPEKTIEKNFSVKKGSLKDPRDNNIYETCIVGTQTWMAEDIRYKTKEGSYYFFELKEENKDKYGYTYLPTVIEDVCPAGWHLPSRKEFNELIDYVGGVNMVQNLISTAPLPGNLKLRYEATDLVGFNAKLLGHKEHFNKRSTIEKHQKGKTLYFTSEIRRINDENFVYALKLDPSYSTSFFTEVFEQLTQTAAVRCLKD